MGAPQKEFKTQNDNIGFGLQLQGTFPSPGVTSPIVIGLSGNFLVFSTSEKEKKVKYGFFDVKQSSELSSNMAQFHVFLQLAPFTGPFKPYVEILGGGNLLWTDATVKMVDTDDYDFDEDKFQKDDSFSDFTYSYGAGAGFLISLTPLPTSDLYLDLKVRYTRGGEAEFVTVENTEVDFDEGKIYFTPTKAMTDLLTFHLGVSLFF